MTKHSHGKAVALKILTAEWSQNQRLEELKCLETLRDADPSHPGATRVLALLDSFRLEGPNGNHLCIVTTPMGVSLLSFCKEFEDGRVPLPLAKQSSEASFASIRLHSPMRNHSLR
jgi:serine/threonine-protein kinase SRPK3